MTTRVLSTAGSLVKRISAAAEAGAARAKPA
jgi:hypothetical protein